MLSEVDYFGITRSPLLLFTASIENNVLLFMRQYPFLTPTSFGRLRL